MMSLLYWSVRSGGDVAYLVGSVLGLESEALSAIPGLGTTLCTPIIVGFESQILVK